MARSLGEAKPVPQHSDADNEKRKTEPRCKSNEVPVTVKVYPYREGSKVSFEFAFAFTLKPNGESTYATGEADQLKSTIQSVAGE